MALVKNPKFKMPKVAKVKSASIRVKGFVSSPKEMKHKAASFGKGAEGRLGRWAKGKV